MVSSNRTIIMITYGDPISDPNQVSQLNGASLYGDPVTDPTQLSELNDNVSQSPSASQQLIGQAQQQAAPVQQNGSYLENLSQSNSLIPADFLLKMALSNYNPTQTAKSVAEVVGNSLSMPGGTGAGRETGSYGMWKGPEVQELRT